MKLSVSINASTQPAKATIIVDDNNEKVYTTSCVKQSSGRFAINLEKIENVPQKWILVPSKANEPLTDMTFTRDLDGSKTTKSSTKTNNKPRYEVTMPIFLESTIAAVAASEELTDDEVESITAVIQPILDRIKKTDERKQLEAKLQEAQSLVESILTQLTKLSE